MKTYIVDYTLEINNEVIKTFHFESADIWEGFRGENGVRATAEKLGATVYRKVTEIRAEEILGNGIFLKSNR